MKRINFCLYPVWRKFLFDSLFNRNEGAVFNRVTIPEALFCKLSLSEISTCEIKFRQNRFLSKWMIEVKALFLGPWIDKKFKSYSFNLWTTSYPWNLYVKMHRNLNKTCVKCIFQTGKPYVLLFLSKTQYPFFVDQKISNCQIDK